MKITVEAEWLINQREQKLIEHDRAYPGLGPGIEFGGYSRIIAIRQLKDEGILPEEYVGDPPPNVSHQSSPGT